MARASVTGLRRKLRSYLERAEAGEEIVVRRRGREVARILPTQREPQRFPDLTELRESTKLSGEPMSETVIRQRRESRY